MKDTVTEQSANDSQSLIDARNWYASLSANAKQSVGSLIAQSIKMAVFSAAVMVDGHMGMFEVGSGRAEICLTVRLYDSVETAITGEPDDEVRISPAEEGYYIHDLFKDMFDEHEAKGT